MATLKAFDELVMPYTQWRETNDGGQGLEVLNDTRHLFRFPELTRELGYFEECLGVAVSEVDAEIKHTISYDRAMDNIRQAADLPDDRVRDFVMFVLQNNGTLPRRRVKKDFADIDPDTLSEMEAAVQEAFDLPGASSPDTTPTP